MIPSFLLALGATIIVSPAGPVRTLTAALALARPGDRIVVRAGSYREPRILVGVRVEIAGEGGPVFEGGAHGTMAPMRGPSSGSAATHCASSRAYGGVTSTWR